MKPPHQPTGHRVTAITQKYHLLLERGREIAVQIHLELGGLASNAELIVEQLIDVLEEQRGRAGSTKHDMTRSLDPHPAALSLSCRRMGQHPRSPLIDL